MFFTGDSSTRKRVDLGGRSSKERDRQKLLEQARLERKRRLRFRQKTLAAVKIQKWFRWRKSVKLARLSIREQFYTQYGDHCQKVERHCFNPDSDFLLQLLFIFNARDVGDFNLLVETCRLLHHFVDVSGNILNVFGFMDFPSKQSIIKNRVKRFALACVQAIHQNSFLFQDLLMVWMSMIHAQLLITLVVIMRFVTGCSRGPLLGFKYLEPRFCIQRAAPDDASEDTLDRLPTSATCMNLLKLPPYKSKEKMEMKLVYAINADPSWGVILCKPWLTPSLSSRSLWLSYYTGLDLVAAATAVYRHHKRPGRKVFICFHVYIEG